MAKVKSKKAKKSKSEEKVKKSKKAGRPAKAEKTSKKKTKKTKATKAKTTRARKSMDLTPITDKLTQSQLFELIETKTEVPKRDVKKVVNALQEIILGSVIKKSRGEFMMPGMFKVVRRDVPAKPKRKVRNPATGEMVWAKPKPASKKVVIRPMVKLKKAVKGEL